MTPSVESLGALEATPHARVFDGEPRTVRLSLDAGESVPTHQHPGRVVVAHVLEGDLHLRVGDDVLELAAGDVARFDGAQDVEPTARTAATALLVLAKRAD